MGRWIRRAVVVLSLAFVAACDEDPTGTARVVRVEVGPADQVVTVGDSATVTAVALTVDDVVVPGVVLWRSLSPTIATISVSGSTAKVAAKTPGVARIEAESGGRTGFVDVTVVAAPLPPPAQVATVEISPSGFSLPVNHETPVQAIVKDVNGQLISGLPVMWTSTVEAVASITPIGVSPFASLLAKSAGTTIIRATVAGVTAEMTFQVTAAPPPANEPIYLFFSTFHRGIWTNQLLDFRQFLTAHGTNGPIENPVVVWSIDDTSIAEVDEYGNVRGLTKGTTRLRATAGDVTATTLVTVFQPVPSPVVYDLTFDWWDGEWHMLPEVGTATWTDDNGAEHEVVLWPTSGSITMTDGGDYMRVLVFQGWAVVNGVNQVVIEREVVDTGTASIMVGGETGYRMHSETTPGEVYELIFHQPGNMIMRAEVGTAPEHQYMFRMRQ